MAAVKAVELEGVIYCTFENVQGSMIDCQYPDDFISTENFKLISHAVIPRAELTDQPITIAEFGHFVIGFPQRIEGTQYSRNTLLFNLCFIVSSRTSRHQNSDLTRQDFPLDIVGTSNGLQTALQYAYELTVRKINRYLAHMEEENAALSQNFIKRTAKNGNETRIHKFLRQIYTELREQGLCVTGLGDEFPPLYLIFAPRYVNGSASSSFTPTEEELPTGWHLRSSSDDSSEDAPVGGSDVWSRVPTALHDSIATVTDSTVFVRVHPILTSIDNHLAYVLEPSQGDDGLDSDNFDRNQSSFWETRDLASSRLLPFINGQRTVAQVSSLASVDRSIARLCMTQLAQLGAIHAVSSPIFQHSAAFHDNNSMELFSIPGYVGLPRLLRLITDDKLRNACFESVLSTWTRRRRLHLHDPEGLILKILQVFSKLCASPYLNLSFLLASTQSFVDLILPQSLSSQDMRSTTAHLPGISLIRLVQFGEVNSLIHRLHCYPVSEGISTGPVGLAEAQANTDTRLWNLLRDRMMDGVQSVDDLVYEASAWAVKSHSSTVSRNPSSLLCVGEREPMAAPVSNTTFSDAVVAFTSKLLKEKDELNKRSLSARTSSVLTEVNSTERHRSGASSSVSSEHQSLIRGRQRRNAANYNALHLLWH
ncbi:hypothetical protein Aperf_G00000078709 [Anoplocephala perfoliata]